MGRPNAQENFLRELEGKAPIIDTRKGDRHKGKRNRTGHTGGRTAGAWEKKFIIAYDGEGANLENGEHVYNLLANSEGDRILNHEGLSTVTCLEFFLSTCKFKSINVIYGGSYDVNMILRDLSDQHLAQLWSEKATNWGPYRIMYTPRKLFSVHKYRPGFKEPATFTLWDVIGYFQTSFVNACRKWLGNIDELQEIERMKFERDIFSVDRIREIVTYNQQECSLLVLLMERLFDAMDQANIRLTRYDGAGSIASALLRQNDVRSHKGELTDEVIEGSQYAYSGGRIEAVKLGTAERTIYRYDINSAYPSTARSLPSFKGATFSVDKSWDGSAHSIVGIEWDYTHRGELPFYPLWVRDPWGHIDYPSTGSGFYYGCEVANVVKHFVEGEDYRFLDYAINVHLGTDEHPFAFIDDVYEQRLKFKAQGSMASEAIKLGMNSLYGKLAQQAGYRDGKIPTYHHLTWAGQITAQTRAMMYDVAMQNPNAIVAFATDAIISEEPLDVTCGTGLGEWSPEVLEGITIVQAGVYWLKWDGEWHDKYRGFDKDSLDRERIIECWRTGETYTASLTRFMGMGSALNSTDLRGVWRKWITQPRRLDILPTGKRVPGPDSNFADGLCLTYARPGASLSSCKYPIAWLDGPDKLGRSKVDPLTGMLDDNGIDIRIFEQEIADQYA